MQKPTYFEHQIINPSQMEFLTSSIDKAVKDNITMLTHSNPGIVNGLDIASATGNGTFVISAGFAYTGDGERIQLYSPYTGTISWGSSTKSIYAKLGSSVFNSDPTYGPTGTGSTVYALNPDNNTYETVQSYPTLIIDITGTSGDVKLGEITANASSGAYIWNASGAQYLKLANILNVNTSTINGSIVEWGTLDSTAFTNPLTTGITLGSGASITNNMNGINNLGDTTNPFNSISALTGNFHTINGMSPITIDSLIQKTGSSLESNLIPVSIDTIGNGVKFGGGIFTNRIAPNGVTGNISISTPSGNISLTSSSGSIYLNNPVISSTDFTVGGNLTVSGSVSIQSITLGQNNFHPKNLSINSDFSMGSPVYYTGGTIFNYPDNGNIGNSFVNMAVVDPFESRYAKSLFPYSYSIPSGTQSVVSGATYIIGNSTFDSKTVATNTLQTITAYNGLALSNSPPSGTFYLRYSGGTISGTTTQLTGTMLPATIQAALEAVPVIGTGNVIVYSTGGIAPFIYPLYVQFAGALGGSGTPTLQLISGTWSGSPLITGNITPIITGAAAVPNLYADPSSAYDIPGLNSFLVVSATGLINNPASMSFPTGCIYLTLPSTDLKNNSNYNVSFYYYPSSASMSSMKLEVGAFSSRFVLDTTQIGNWSALSTIQSGTSGWKRLATSLTIGSGSSMNPYIVMRMYPGTIATTPQSGTFKMTGLQVTEGPNYFGYMNNSKKIYSIIEPSGVLKPSEWAGTQPTGATNVWIDAKAITAGSTLLQSTICSGSIYSNGGFAEIHSFVRVFGSATTDIGASIYVDKNPIDYTFTNAGTAGREMSLGKNVYLSPGVHSIELRAIANGGTLLSNATSLAMTGNATFATNIGVTGAFFGPRISVAF